MNDWIGTNSESPWLRRGFDIEEEYSVKIMICGVGYFELYCNGEKVSEDLFTPVWSQYERVDGGEALYTFNDELSYRVYYLEYDLTDYVRKGRNMLGIWLGNGWYNQHERTVEGNFFHGNPKVFFRVEITDKSGIHFVESDKNTLWCQSSVVYNNIYYGERQDFALERKNWCMPDGDIGDGWQKATIVQAPAGKLCLQTCPADRVMRTITPRYIGEYDGGKLYDVGENITGWAVLRCVSQGEVSVKYAEYKKPSGEYECYANKAGDKLQQDIFYCTGEHILRPHFTWHGFQFFVVYGSADVISCEVVHTNIKATYSFHCENETLCWLFDAYIRTQLENYHGGVPSDCPHRERLGYTGDGALTVRAALLFTDSDLLYYKWIDDILDCQDIRGGHIQHTAPYYGGGGGPGGWGSAVIEVPWALYLKTHDKDILKKTFEPMVRWLNYMHRHSSLGLVSDEYPDGLSAVDRDKCWCLGEWLTPQPVQIPEDYINTYFFIKSLYCVLEIADILENTEHKSSLELFLNEAVAGINKAYYNSVTGDFCENIQGANAFAVDVNLGDNRTLANIIKKYEKTPLDTGIFGTDVLIRTLFKHGESELAVKLLTEPESPFTRMQKASSTTLWESYHGDESRNHPMFGAVVRYLFEYELPEKLNAKFEKLL